MSSENGDRLHVTWWNTVGRDINLFKPQGKMSVSKMNERTSLIVNPRDEQMFELCSE